MDEISEAIVEGREKPIMELIYKECERRGIKLQSVPRGNPYHYQIIGGEHVVNIFTLGRSNTLQVYTNEMNGEPREMSDVKEIVDLSGARLIVFDGPVPEQRMYSGSSPTMNMKTREPITSPQINDMVARIESLEADCCSLLNAMADLRKSNAAMQEKINRLSSIEAARLIDDEDYKHDCEDRGPMTEIAVGDVTIRRYSSK